MLKRIITHFICIVMIGTSISPVYATSTVTVLGMDEATIRATYPEAKIIHVSADEYPLLADKLEGQGYQLSSPEHALQIADSSRTRTETRDDFASSPYLQPIPDKNDCDNRNRDANVTGSLQVGVDITNAASDSGGDAKGAAILFVFVGAVVLVVWTLYVFKYLYDVSLGYHPCRWSELSVVSSSISSDTQQHAYFTGINYKTGVSNSGTEFGISAELGHSDILLVESGTLRLEGLYWFVGPMLRWRLSSGRNSNYLEMDFLAGSTEHEEMGVIAKADLGLRFGIGNAMHLALNWGAMNINLHDNQGIVTETDQYHYLYGVSVGFQF